MQAEEPVTDGGQARRYAGGYGAHGDWGVHFALSMLDLLLPWLLGEPRLGVSSRSAMIDGAGVGGEAEVADQPGSQQTDIKGPAVEAPSQQDVRRGTGGKRDDGALS